MTARRTRPPATPTQHLRATWIGAAGMAGFGAFLLLIAWLDPRDEAFPNGRGVVFGVGAAILALAVSIAFDALRRRWRLDARSRRASIWIAGTLLAALLVAASVWTAHVLRRDRQQQLEQQPLERAIPTPPSS